MIRVPLWYVLYIIAAWAVVEGMKWIGLPKEPADTLLLILAVLPFPVAIARIVRESRAPPEDNTETVEDLTLLPSLASRPLHEAEAFLRSEKGQRILMRQPPDVRAVAGRIITAKKDLGGGVLSGAEKEAAEQMLDRLSAMMPKHTERQP